MIDLPLSALLKNDSIILFSNGFRNIFAKLFSTASMNRSICLSVCKLVRFMDLTYKNFLKLQKHLSVIIKKN